MPRDRHLGIWKAAVALHGLQRILLVLATTVLLFLTLAVAGLAAQPPSGVSTVSPAVTTLRQGSGHASVVPAGGGPLMNFENLIRVPGFMHSRITADARPPMKRRPEPVDGSAGYTTAPHEWGFPDRKRCPSPMMKFEKIIRVLSPTGPPA
ncbi:MAG: hypothetical protein ACE5F6_22235, partial [Anaerolineae bacterium]